MQCQYCNDTLSTPSNLKRHQETSKKCLTLRGLPHNKKLKKKLCSVPECGRGAISGSDKCSKHGGGKRCSELGCGSSARSGSDKCSKHGGGERCSELGCENGAQGESDKCSKHGGGERCSELGCENGAQGESDKCSKHGGGKRCPNCIDWIDSRCGDSKYDGYCATCFKRVFPDDPRSKVIYSHTKEIRVRNAISEYSEKNKEFEGFIHDRALYTKNCDCTHKRRIDHRKLFGNTILAIETDEFCHRGYDKYDEEIRYDDIYMIHSGKWIFIRFNPDNTRTDKTDIEDRITQLLEEMETQIERIKNDENEELVEIIKMFY